MMTIDDLAYHLAVSARHIERLVKINQVPQPIRLGKSTRWIRSDVESWIAARCQQADA